MSVSGGSGKHEHLSDEEVLLACDGEAGPGVERHLSACESCRDRVAEVRQLEKAYRNTWWKEERLGLAKPPRAWRALPAEGRARRRPAVSQQWLAVAAALAAVAGVSLWQQRSGESPAAAPASRGLGMGEVIERARDAEQRWQASERIALRSSRGGMLVRPAVWVRRRGEAHPLEQLFRRAGYSWEQPLSVRSYAAWRERLPQKEEWISRARDPKTAEPVYVLRTRTSANVLEEATLSVRERDLQPVSGRLRFAGQDVVEMERVVDVAGRADSAAPAEAGSGERRVTDQAMPGAGMLEELQVLAALHGIGADLGEPVTTSVEPDGSRVVVSAPGITARRQQQMRQALEGLTFAELRFDPAGGAGTNPVGARARQAPRAAQGRGGADAALRMSVEGHLQGRQSFEQFVDDALDTSDAAAARAHALAALAEKYPRDVEERLPGEGRQLLGSMRRDHLTAMQRHLTRLSALLKEGFGIESGGGRPEAASTEWQQAALALRTAMQEFDRQITGMLTGAGGGEAVVESLGASLRKVEQQWEALAVEGRR